jgi:hypothetical protein
MNPLVKVSAAAGSTDAALAPSLESLTGQDLVIATGLPLGQLQQLNALARQAGANFMAGGASGPGGWFFVDLREHCYVPKVCALHCCQLLCVLAFSALQSMLCLVWVWI